MLIILQSVAVCTRIQLITIYVPNYLKTCFSTMPLMKYHSDGVCFRALKSGVVSEGFRAKE